MPEGAPHACAHPGCPGHAPMGERFCPSHEGSYRPRGLRWPSRGSSAARGYGAAWQRNVAYIKATRILCEDPLGVHKDRPVFGQEVHHITSKANGGSDDATNLQLLCKSCHSRITAMQDGGFGNERRTDLSNSKEGG
jgi:5-methylcytosine-specific restriction protein A